MIEFNVWQQLPIIAPEIGLVVMAVVVLLLDSYLPIEKTRNIAIVAAVGMAALTLTVFWPTNPELTGQLVWGGMIRFDPLSQIFKVMILLAGAITSLMSTEDSGINRLGEFHLVIVVATLGGTLLASAADLIMVFVALETVSIPLYVLAAFNRNSEKSAESGLKYFLFGSFASAIMLYGFSLLYGFTGTTSLDGIAAGLTAGETVPGLVPVLVALVLVIVGIGFKISMVPFHFWTPDVYEGAPTPVTAFVSVASKAASFALLVRFLLGVFPESVAIDGQVIQNFWVNMLTFLSIVTMTVGNVLALRQKNVKRMLAYSSIAQAGYTLIGVAAIQSGSSMAVGSIAFYMFMYTFTNLLVFAGVVMVNEKVGGEQISDLAGINRRNPWLALTMTIGLLSLAGIPPAAGFFGKFFLFQAAVEAGLITLVIIAVLNAIVSLYYYLVVIKIMYVDHGVDEDQPIVMPRTYGWVLGITTVAVLLLGILPAPIIEWARNGAEVIRIAGMGM